jgi:predicted metal-dependent hydrolase
MPSLALGDRRIEYRVVRGRGRRYTYFRFKADATLEVVVPGRARAFDAETAIRNRQAWVLRHHARLTGSGRVFDGHSVLFEGRRLEVVFERTGGAESLRASPEDGKVFVRGAERSAVRELVRRWFLQESSAYVASALPSLARRLGATYRRADVREMKNWGYCTRDGRLSFSWQLIVLPKRVREYILCHELVHLSEHNHSASFKRLLAKTLPDFRQREAELDGVVPI